MAKLKKIVKWLICLSSFVLFGFLTYWVVNGKFYQVDNLVYKKIFELISPLNINIFVKLLTNFAGPELLIFLCVVLLVLITDKKVSIGICSNLVLSTLLNIIIKNIVARPRPSVESLIIENGYSFPSGHSMACVAFYGFLIYLLWQTKYPKKAKITLTSILSLLILMVGVSRIYLGVHYFSDVLAGFVLSLGYLIIFVTIYSKIKIPKRKKGKRKKRLLQ